jgi:hypothetical protein
MSLDKTIRENLDGKYLTIHTEHFREGIEYAAKIKIQQILLIGRQVSDITVDFKEFDKLSKSLRVISFIQDMGNVLNFDSIYNLKEMRNICFQDKQKFTIDISRFTKLQHLGSDYWKGLVNLDKAYSLTSMVICKYPFSNLSLFSELRNLQILHIYSSQIRSLDGIEKLPIKELCLAINNKLEDIHKINEISTLERLDIERCKMLTDFTFLRGNPYIQDLLIDKPDSIDFIVYMPNLKKINFWNCKDGNMNPLLQSQSLEVINFYPNKKHYTHTIKEINKATSTRRGLIV